MTDQGPAISLFDESGRKRLELSHAAAASGLRLLDTHETPIASLQASHDAANVRLEIRSPQGASLTKADGFSVEDSAGNRRLQLTLVNGNFPLFGVSQSDQQGPPSVEIAAGDDGSRSVKLHDQEGHPLFSVSATENGRTFLNMRHPAHERSLQISAGPLDLDGPRIAFFAPAREDGSGGLLPPLQLGLQKGRQPYIRMADHSGQSLFTAPEPQMPPVNSPTEN